MSDARAHLFFCDVAARTLFMSKRRTRCEGSSRYAAAAKKKAMSLMRARVREEVARQYSGAAATMQRKAIVRHQHAQMRANRYAACAEPHVAKR